MIINFDKRYIYKDLFLDNFIILSNKESLFVLSMRNEESIRKWMINSNLITEKEHIAFINTLKGNTKSLYLVVKRDDFTIGVISLIRMDMKKKSANIGIYKNPFAKLSKIGDILMDALHHVAFDVLQLCTLKLEVIETNEKAIRLYEKYGYKKMKTKEARTLQNNTLHDLIIMEKNLNNVRDNDFENR